jgi:phosphoribosylanthranilate isomerase
MIDGIQFKVCGLTSLVDAEFADRCGADYLGFILYPRSPRYVSLVQCQAMAERLPGRRKVAVMVEPGAEQLALALDAGFDFFQIHYRHDRPLAAVAEWAEAVGAGRLWLAPKLPSGIDVSAAWLPLANHFLLDTFQADGFGGSGRASDWPKFARHQRAHPGNTWILSGGLGPDNIGAAIRESGARFVDVNSGVESAPGVKDHEEIKRFVARLHETAQDR